MFKRFIKPFVYIVSFAIIFFPGCSRTPAMSDNPEVDEEEILCQPIVLKSAERNVCASVNGFGINVFKAIAQDRPNEDIAFSPFSLSLDLALCAGGAQGKTQSEIVNALGFGSESDDVVAGFFQKMVSGITHVDPNVVFKSANSVWADSKYPLKNAYVSYAKSHFDADLYSLDLSSKESITRINQWCNENTSGLIPSVFDESKDPDSEVVSYLLNALYFNGHWSFDFDEEMPVDVFHSVAGDKDVAYLTVTREEGIGYYETQTARFAAVPYGGRSFYLVIALPKEGVELSEAVFALEETPFFLWENRDEVSLRIPKFDIRYDTGEDVLKSALKKQGIDLAFSPVSADFSEMFESRADFWIDNIMQKSRITVDEKGTEAAAVTVNVLLTSPGDSYTPSSHTMVVDRPFVFAIVENSSNSILFLGQKVE